VLDADARTPKPIATFETAQLETMLQPLGGTALSDPKDRLVIADGQGAIAFGQFAYLHASATGKFAGKGRGSRAPREGAGAGWRFRTLASGTCISKHHFVEAADWCALSHRPLSLREQE
jgi:hypothetical protein